MQLELKPDFAETRQRWEAFWRGDKLDRPMLLLHCLRPNQPPSSWPYPVRPDQEPGPQIENALTFMRSREYFAESVPNFMMEFAAGHFSALIGSRIEYGEQLSGNGWLVPFVESWDETELRFQRDGFYWQRTVELARACRARCDGVFLVNAPVQSAGLDALAAVRGTQRLLTDLVDCPEKVQEALAQVRAAYDEIVAAVAREFAWDTFGSCNWCGLYSSGYTNTIQCDFSCMISSGMFAEFELANLRHQASHYDQVTYHLDGPQARHHLPAVCTVPGIEVIQYVAIPREDPAHVESVYRQALDQGKAIVRGVSAEVARDLWRKYPRARLVLQVDVKTRREAEAFMASFH